MEPANKQHYFYKFAKFHPLAFLEHKLHLLERYEFSNKTHKLVVVLLAI